jgi:hypothetical protein
MNHEISKLDIATTIALLTQHNKVHSLSIAVTVSVMLTMLLLTVLDAMILVNLLGFSLVMVLGVVETVYALRVGFDIGLLRQLQEQGGDIQLGLTRLDETLLMLRLIPAKQVGRDLEVRLQGCLRLLKRQVLCTLLQIAVVIVTTIIDARIIH